MNLLVLTWNYPPTVGGIEQVAFHVVTGLRGHGHAVSVVAAAGTDVEARNHDPFLYRAPKPGLPAFLRHAFIKGWSLAKREKPDAIICPSLTSAPSAWLISKLTGIPCMILIHGSDVLVPRRFYQWCISPLLSGARLLFANSRNTSDLLVRRGLNPDRIRVVCPGVTPPPPATAKPTEQIESLMKKLENRRVLLTVGRLVKRKGIAEFIEQTLPLLVEKYPDVVYLVAGGEPTASLIHHERIGDQLVASIKQHHWQDRVYLLGKISDADLELVYQNSDVFVLPCLDHPTDVEGFGIVILEAALHGVPSVATRHGGIPDAVEEGRTGLLAAPGDFKALAGAISGLLGDPAKLTSLGEAARRRAQSEFTWSAVAKRYESAILSGLSKSS